MDRVLVGAERAFHRRSALGIAAADEADALEAVTKFRASLPSRSRALRVGILAISTLILAHILLMLWLFWKPKGPSWMGSAKQVVDSVLAAFQPDVNSVGSLVNNSLKASPRSLLVAAAVLGVSLYLILRPAASTFRLKRLLFNLYPDAEGMRRDTPASWSMSRSTGVYRLEREAFVAIGARAPSEPPFDLLVSLPIPILWIVYIAVIEGEVLVQEEGYGTVRPWVLLAGVIPESLLFCGPFAVRLAWLAAAWRARNGRPRSTWLFSDEIRVPWRSKPVRCWSLALIGLLICWYIILFPVAGWLWFTTARDLRALGRAYEVKHLRDMRPAVQGLAASLGLAYGLPPMIVFFRAPRYVREAQAAVGLKRLTNRHVVWLAPLWPVLWIVLQRGLNRLWHVEGMRADSCDPAIGSRADVSGSFNKSTIIP